MAIEIPLGLPPELVPLSWLLGTWEGKGYITRHADPQVGGESAGDGPAFTEQAFGQRVVFTHHDLPYLEYRAESWLLDDEGRRTRTLTVESGIWQLERELVEADPGPGMHPGHREHALSNADQVEEFRNEQGGFNVVVTLVHPGGVAELYVGEVKGPRIHLATDAVMRAPGAKDYRAASRMYGLVEGDLLWAWDITAQGNPPQTHASARLAKVVDQPSASEVATA